MKYAVIDGCPAPPQLALFLELLKQDVPGLTYNSIYRGDDAASILHAHGKHTQRELYASMPGGVNPPDRGTHVLLGDGTVGKLHEKLDPMRCGIDVDDTLVKKLIAAGRRRGITFAQPYPSGAEYHHLSATKWADWPTLHVGDTGDAVKLLSRRLAYVVDGHGKPYDAHGERRHFDHALAEALRAYQRDHDLKADGIFGPRAYASLDHATANRKAAERSAKRHAAQKSSHAKPEHVSKAGIDLIARFEGLRLDAYKPVAQERNWTIGYGHSGPDVKAGEHITKGRALELLRHDVESSEQSVLRAFKEYGVPYTQGMLDATTSAVFNLGPGVLSRGRSLGDALAHRDRRKAADALLLYDKDVNGHTLEGLKRRREAERKLFLDGA